MEVLTKMPNPQGLEVDGGFLCDWKTVELIVEDMMRLYDLRYWQAVWNVLDSCGQLGWPYPWPELFYADEIAGHAAFHSRFDIIDGYIVPK